MRAVFVVVIVIVVFVVVLEDVDAVKLWFLN